MFWPVTAIAMLFQLGGPMVPVANPGPVPAADLKYVYVPGCNSLGGVGSSGVLHWDRNLGWWAAESFFDEGKTPRLFSLHCAGIVTSTLYATNQPAVLCLGIREPGDIGAVPPNGFRYNYGVEKITGYTVVPFSVTYDLGCGGTFTVTSP